MDKVDTCREDYQEEEDIEQGRSCNVFLPDVCKKHLVAGLSLHCSECNKSHMVLVFLEQELEYDHRLAAYSQTAFW